MITHVDIYRKAHASVKHSLRWNCWESSPVVDNATLFSRVVIPFYTCASRQNSCYSKFLPIFGIVGLLHFCQLYRWAAISHCAFTLYILVNQYTLLVRLSSFSYMYWTFDFPFRETPVLLWLCKLGCNFTLICRSSLYVQDTSPFPILFVTDITSHSLACFFALLMVNHDKKDGLVFNVARFFSLPSFGYCFLCLI